MKCALIGCGPAGLAYVAAAGKLGIEIAVCADTVSVAARKAASRCRARSESHCDRALAQPDIDAVLICAPLAARPEYVARAARLGKHIFCLSPLANAAAPARKALDALRAASVRLYVAHELRAAPEQFAIDQLLNSGAVGRPGFVRISRHGAPPVGRRSGALEFLLARDLDWLVRRFGVSARVYAQALHRARVSHASATLSFAKGPIVQWIGTCSSAPARTAVEICGTDGMIAFTTDDPVLEIATKSGRTERVSPVATDPHVRHLQNFIAFLGRRRRSEIDHERAVISLHATALASARDRREVRS